MVWIQTINIYFPRCVPLIQVGAGDIIKFPEFLQIMGQKMKMVDPDVVVSSLRVFDKEGNGKIAASELKHILTKMGESLTEREVNQVMADFPPDSKGMIKYEKFVASLLEQYVV
jgi:calmodulin